MFKDVLFCLFPAGGELPAVSVPGGVLCCVISNKFFSFLVVQLQPLSSLSVCFPGREAVLQLHPTEDLTAGRSAQGQQGHAFTAMHNNSVK